MIGLDVLRTDRTMVFYENKENLSKLWDILAVYAWIDKDVGYCQGELHLSCATYLSSKKAYFHISNRNERFMLANDSATQG